MADEQPKNDEPSRDSSVTLSPPHRVTLSSPRRVARLARKELTEILRDRRTIVTLVAMPILLYPLLSVAFLQFAWMGKADAPGGTVYVCGFADAVQHAVFMDRVNRGEIALKRRNKEGAETPTLDARIMTEPELNENLRAGKIDLIVRVPGAEQLLDEGNDGPHLNLKGKSWRFECQIAYLTGSPGGLGALSVVDRLLSAANEVDLNRRLDVAGAPPVVLLQPTRTAIKAQEGDTFASLSSLVPLILILMTITGAVYPAIDLTAGERERGTLEMLVAAPVPRFALLTAKYIAVVTVAVLTAVVNLVSMVITLQVSGVAKQFLGDTGLTPLLIVQMFGLLLLFAAFFSAVLLSLTSFARSFKEAQAYLIPLMLGSLGPGVLAMMPGLKLDREHLELAVLPLVNIVLLARDLFGGGSLDPLLAAVVVTTTLLYALAALALAARVFGAESVLYSEQSGWSDLLRRPSETSATPTIASALWCLALAVPIHFLVQGLFQPKAEDISPQTAGPIATRLMLVAIMLSIALFAGLPALAAYLGRVRPLSGFGLAVPRLAAIVAGLVLGVSIWPLVLRFLEQGLSVEGRHEQIVSAMRQASESAGLPLMLATMIVAAISEELFFRGYLFSALRARTGAVVTIGVSAVLFGLTHVFHAGALGLDRLAPATLLGVVLGTVCWISGSIWPGMLLHVCHNAMLVLLLQTELSRQNEVPTAWVAAGIAGTLVGAAVLWLAGRKVSSSQNLQAQP